MTVRRGVVSAIGIACLVLAGCSTQPAASPYQTSRVGAAAVTDAPAGSPTATPTAGTPEEVIERAVREPSGIGVSACQLVDGVGAWSGLAGSEAGGDPVTASTRWHTGSIGKTVTAAEVLRLAERGELALDEPAANRIPEGLETNGATIRDLLRMRSGLDTGSPPGTVFTYRNGDYELLGNVIEGVVGRPLGDVLTADILRVPGAEGLVFPAGGGVANAAGPLETDCSSLAHWGDALFAGRLLAQSSLSLMTDFSDGEYGMGVFDFSSDFGEPAYGHLGEDGHWSAGLVYLPDRQTTIVGLMNYPDFERPFGVLVDLARVLGQ